MKIGRLLMETLYMLSRIELFSHLPVTVEYIPVGAIVRYSLLLSALSIAEAQQYYNQAMGKFPIQ